MEQMTRVNPMSVSIKDGFVLVLRAMVSSLHSTCTSGTKEKENLENSFSTEEVLHHARKVLGKCGNCFRIQYSKTSIESAHAPDRFAVYPQHCILCME